MKKQKQQILEVKLDRIIGGGQTIGTLDTGKKAIVWDGLPGETVTLVTTKSKSHFVEGIVTDVITASKERVEPLDKGSYLSTSPWQIMTFEAEQHYKSALIEEAFELHDIVLPKPIEIYTDNVTTKYRNKVEFSWYSEDKSIAGGTEAGAQPSASSDDTLDLAFFRRASKGKITLDSCSLLPDSIMDLALAIRDLLASKNVSARTLKTLLIRTDQKGNAVWQLYVKDKSKKIITNKEAEQLPAQGGETIYSDPRSPASKITERLATFGNVVLTDELLGIKFRYATEGFFQVNIPVYEQALKDMREWIPAGKVVDLYAGVGSIGLTIGGDSVTLVEINQDAVREMNQNIESLGRQSTARAVLAPSEKALDTITGDSCIVVDPPRAGLHADVVAKLLEAKPERIVYLSCNPVTQARDVALLATGYGVKAHKGYNFFPRTPHIEHLIVLDKLPN